MKHRRSSWRKQKKRGHKHYPRRNYKSRHHLTPQVRGGDFSPENIALLWNDKHQCWHRIFGERTLEEVIELLIRFARIKGRAKC